MSRATKKCISAAAAFYTRNKLATHRVSGIAYMETWRGNFRLI